MIFFFCFLLLLLFYILLFYCIKLRPPVASIGIESTTLRERTILRSTCESSCLLLFFWFLVVPSLHHAWFPSILRFTFFLYSLIPLFCCVFLHHLPSFFFFLSVYCNSTLARLLLSSGDAHSDRAPDVDFFFSLPFFFCFFSRICCLLFFSLSNDCSLGCLGGSRQSWRVALSLFYPFFLLL